MRNAATREYVDGSVAADRGHDAGARKLRIRSIPRHTLSKTEDCSIPHYQVCRLETLNGRGSLTSWSLG